jgi:phenylacetate-CoA ligase
VLYPLHEQAKGTGTFRWLRRLEATQWLDSAQLQEIQLVRLREHLQFAFDHVPYYRRLLTEHDIVPGRIYSLDDFRRVPFLTRDLLRAHFDDLRARIRLRGVQRVATGGSTGSPVTVLVDAERTGFGQAARLRSHRWFGLEPGAREVVLWGSPIELGRQDRLRSARDWLLNSALLSAFDLGETALARYASFIGRFRPEKLYGYASALSLMARYLSARSWRPPGSLKAVFTTAEPLFDFQRQAIAEAFGCAVATEYGARDGGLMATECPAGSLHVPAEGILVEVENGGSNGLGEIVVTNLYSDAMPIIRYRTGDLGRLDPTPCSCGRGLPRLQAVEGRRTDFLVTPDGRVLHALSVIYILRETPGLSSFRVVQESIDRLGVLVVPRGPLPGDASDALQAKIRRLMGPGVEVSVETVSVLPFEASGKFRYVVSKVADERLGELLAGVAARAR